jgi:hypothetical protein
MNVFIEKNRVFSNIDSVEPLRNKRTPWIINDSNESS